MKFKFIQLFVIINLIKFFLLDSSEYDLGKYGTYKTVDYCIIFNPTQFEIGETMFFKISAKEFNDEYLYYEYIDDLEQYEFNFQIKKLHEVKYYYSYEPGEDNKNDKAIHYFKIVKSKEDLGDFEGKYLILYCSFEGTAEIENTEKDEGKKSQIYSIVFSVIAVIAIIIIAYFCFFRKRCKKDDGNGEIQVVQYNPEDNQNIQNNNQNMNVNNKNKNMNNKYMKPKKNANKNEYNDNNNNFQPLANNNNLNNIPDTQYTGNGNIENNNINNAPDVQYTGNGGFEHNPNNNQYYNVPQSSMENRQGYTQNNN